MKKIVVMTLMLSLLACGSGYCEERGLAGNIFVNGFFGGLVGTMVGGALMALTDKPEDHVDNLRYGAAIGVLAGATFGVVDYSLNTSLAEIEDGKIKVAFPTLHPEVVERDGKEEVRVVAQLVRGSF